MFKAEEIAAWVAAIPHVSSAENRTCGTIVIIAICAMLAYAALPMG